MSERVKSLVFAALLCAVCSVLLATASTGLQRFQRRNMLIDKHRNVLMAVGLLKDEESYTAQQIERLYAERIEALWVDEAGRLVDADQRSAEDLPLYVYRVQDRLEAYIVPINSRGLWGRISGYLALEADGSTVAGFTVYKHQETPGLGGEIEKRWFQRQFEGKQIINRQGEFVSIGIAKGDVEKQLPPSQQPHYVDGISGATLTGKYLTAGLRETLQNYEPVSIRFRRNRMDAEMIEDKEQ
jgi:Na+-transporting NADH:ubiquinone oxidoreductase subunit C